MAISGPRIARRSKVSRALFAALCAAGVLLGGCATSFELGRKPPVEKLSALTPGVSTVQDVIGAFGEPQGRGVARMPNYPLADVLLYESSLMEGAKVHSRMLVVYVDKASGTYQGYMWFFGGQIVGPNK